MPNEDTLKQRVEELERELEKCEVQEIDKYLARYIAAKEQARRALNE